MAQPLINHFPLLPHDPVYVNVEEELRRLGRDYTHRLYAHYEPGPIPTTDIFITEWRIACATYINLISYGLDQQQSCIVDGIPFGPTPAPGVVWSFVTSQPYVVLQRWLFDGLNPDPGYKGAVKVVVKMKVGYKVTPALRGMKMAHWRRYPEVEAEKRIQLGVAIARARFDLQAIKQTPRVTYADGYPKSAGSA